MTRIATLRLLLGLVAATVLAMATNNAFGAAPAQPKKWALIIHTGNASTAEAERFGRVLVNSWGFDADTTITLLDEGATTGTIREAMFMLLEEFRPYDELLIVASLPLRSDKGGESLVAYDSDPEAPWSTVDIESFAELLKTLPSSSALIILPSCSGALVPPVARSDRAGTRFLESLAAGKSSGVVDVLQVCDRQLLVEPASSSAESSLATEVDERRGLVFALAMDALEQRVSAGRIDVSARDLADALGAAADGLSVRFSRVPEYERRGWTFSYAPPDFEQYQQPYLLAKSSVERTRILNSMASSAVKSADPTPQTYFLRGVALDTDALLGSRGTASEKLESREAAVVALGTLASTTAEDALRAIAKQANAESVRSLTITQLALLDDADNPNNLDIVRDALDDAAAVVRASAIRATIRLSDTASLDSLARLITSDTDPGVRAVAVRALSSLGPETHTESLLAALGDDAADVRREAAIALGRRGESSEATLSLLRLLDSDPNSGVRQAAASAIGKTSTAATSDRSVDACRVAAGGADYQLAVAATYALGDIGGRPAETALLRLLDVDRPTGVRVAAAESLGQMKSPRALRDLGRAATSDSSPALRRAAVASVGQIGGDRASNILLEALRDDDVWVREEAERALRDLEDSPAVSLLANLENEDTPVSARVDALKKLSAMENIDNTGILFETLGDRDGAVREAAIVELVRIGSDDVVNELGDLLNPNSTSIYIQSQMKLGGEYRSFSQEKVLQARSAAVALGLLPGSVATDRLLEAARDPSNPARLQAAQSLALVDCLLPSSIRRLGSTKYVGESRRTVRLSYDECMLQGGEFPALVDSTVEALLALTEDRYAEIRAAAVTALAANASEARVQDRLEILARNDESTEVRTAAIGVLRRNRPFSRAK